MDDIVRQLSVKYNLPEEIVNKIIRSQFEFVKDTMEEGEFEAVHLHYFGKFGVKKGAKYWKEVYAREADKRESDRT